MKKEHLPSFASRGFSGPAFCGRHADYETEDYQLIYDRAAEYLEENGGEIPPKTHYCKNCLKIFQNQKIEKGKKKKDKKEQFWRRVARKVIQNDIEGLDNGIDLLFHAFENEDVKLGGNLCVTAISILLALRIKSPELVKLINEEANRHFSMWRRWRLEEKGELVL